MSGLSFGRLTISRRAPDIRGVAAWWCTCECGITRAYTGCAIRRGRTKICECIVPKQRRANAAAPRNRHRATWISWECMLNRCYRVDGPDYHRYGARGIRVCEAWRVPVAAGGGLLLASHKDRFLQFLSDMGERPQGMTLDRVDNMADYAKANCRWADPMQQGRNKRNNRLLTHDGQTLTVSQWAEMTGIGVYALHSRLWKGWPVERALTAPVRARRKRPFPLA